MPPGACACRSAGLRRIARDRSAGPGRTRPGDLLRSPRPTHTGPVVTRTGTPPDTSSPTTCVCGPSGWASWSSSRSASTRRWPGFALAQRGSALAKPGPRRDASDASRRDGRHPQGPPCGTVRTLARPLALGVTVFPGRDKCWKQRPLSAGGTLDNSPRREPWVAGGAMNASSFFVV